MLGNVVHMCAHAFQTSKPLIGCLRVCCCNSAADRWSCTYLPRMPRRHGVGAGDDLAINDDTLTSAFHLVDQLYAPFQNRTTSIHTYSPCSGMSPSGEPPCIARTGTRDSVLASQALTLHFAVSSSRIALLTVALTCRSAKHSETDTAFPRFGPSDLSGGDWAL
ncbi:hypothetical protein M011DRAFT_112 [Sporormia fimetaria CBS 119925]|uniref:Uncharacterized protein n=1 Tax=Sporormia fimetaria CBS 119925 TaxID=1340428 RepID=A0A6A6VLX7_9PLEO|nr:hypothetical protein M011DRAFT_112 [Sporormia fimetaria CBS 119925]